MIDRPSSQIERETSAKRHDLDQTIGELKSRLTPESLIEYGTEYVRGPGGQQMLHAARSNPIPAALALIGIGWLFYAATQQNKQQHRQRASHVRVSPGVASAAVGSYGSGQSNLTGAGRPGVMGDMTEEQNLNQPGNPSARITQGEVEQAFGAKNRDGLPH